MLKRQILHAVVLAAGALVASPVRAQAPDIAHDAVACLVAGKYPRLRACFSSPVAKARVFFRREDRPIWYHVAMTPDAQCFEGVLPRPNRELVGKKVPYYVEVASQSLDVGRTQEHEPVVVRTEAECRVKAVAPYLSKAAVKVFPEMPPGFTAGGLGTSLVAGGAAVVVGIGAGVLAGGNDGSDARPPQPPPPSPAPPPGSTVPPGSGPPPPPPPPPGSNGPPNGVFVVSPDPPLGASPMAVRFNLCRSTDPDNDTLVFRFDFGDGQSARGSCREDHTYQAPPNGEAVYTVTACVTDGRPGNEQCRTYQVRVQGERVAPPVTRALSVTVAGTGAGNVSGPNGIACPGTCSGGFGNGEVVTLTAAPAAGSTFGGWTGAGCGASLTCTVTMNADQAVTATFDAIPMSTLDVTLPGNGTGRVTAAQIDCPGDCSGTYPTGTQVTLQAVVGAGSTFGGWSVPACGQSLTCPITLNSSQTVTATFNLITPFPLTVALAGTGTGRVDGPNIACPGDCTDNVNGGSSVTLRATATGQSSFTGWSVASCGTAPSCTFTMPSAPFTVTATFDLPPPTGRRITLLHSGPGNVESDHQPGIVCPNACSYPDFPDGSTVTLIADRPVTWGGDCAGNTGLTCALVMTQDRQASADFPVSAPPPSTALSWLSDLRVPKGRGQVIANQRAWEVASGQQRSALDMPPGEGRIEATLTQAGGAGSWRFELPSAVEPGTLRVLEGKVESLTANAVVFRLAGKPGERVSFVFRLTR
jgi:hypothetical protein